MSHRYAGTPDHAHDSVECTGILLVNLGTPDAPTPRAVRRYLAEFLSDPRVIELPRWLWLPVLHGVILNVRPRRTAAAYREVWTPAGSPLRTHSERQRAALERELDARARGPVRVTLGMRYGEPSIAAALAALRDAGATRILVLPLYPQYSATTTGSVFDAVAATLSTWRRVPELRFVGHYHDDPGYVGALVDSLEESTLPPGGRTLLSFHGLPRRYLLAGDPYFCHCQKTARLLAAAAGLADDAWAIAFQSRVGREEWLRPYTDEVLEQWGREGVPAVRVLCPGFSADCLETLEEVAIRYRALFLDAGGGEFDYVPALNDRPAHVRALADLVHAHAADWLKRPAEGAEERARRRDRARALGAAR